MHQHVGDREYLRKQLDAVERCGSGNQRIPLAVPAQRTDRRWCMSQPDDSSTTGSTRSVGRRVARRATASGVVLLVVVAAVLIASIDGPREPDSAVTQSPGGDGTASLGLEVTAMPPVGACYRSPPSTRSMSKGGERHELAPCDAEHHLETFSVGSFAKDGAYPSYANPDTVAAYEVCGLAAVEFLGGDWRTAYVWLILTVPSVDAWTQHGARWYRCDLSATEDPYGNHRTSSRTTLRGGLAGARALAITCFDWTTTASGTETDFRPADCATSHDAEFVGYYRIPFVNRRDYDPNLLGALEGCAAAAAKYLGSEPGRELIVLSNMQDIDDTRDLPDHHLCALTHAALDGKLVGSVKGLGTAAPSIV